MSLFNELKRRNVFKVGAAYLIIGWLIMQIGEVMAPALHLPEWILSALAFFLILGFPLAIFFAWAFEMTPEGLKKEKDVDRGESIAQVTGQKLNHVIIGLLVVALAYFAFDKFVLEPGRHDHLVESVQQQAAEQPSPSAAEEPGPVAHSIAVLPLVDMSPESDNEYFSDGLTEELLNVLARIRELRVAGRTSSFAFKGQSQDLTEIAEKLRVNHILEGSVRKDDARNRVRITLQLISAEDGYHLWSETYDRDLEDIFAIQEEVAREVAAALRVKLLGEDEQRLENVASTDISAFDLYLQATQNIRQGGYTDLEEAVSQLQQVLTMDPAYLPARLALVKAWGKLALTGAITFEEAKDRGLPVLDSILAQHPRNAEAHAYKALLLVDFKDTEEADRLFRRSLELDPSNAVHLGWYGRVLFEKGDLERGLQLVDRAVELDPYSVEALWQQCRMKAALQLVEQATEACTRVGEIEPDSVIMDYGVALVHMFSGDIARGAAGYVDALEHDPRDYEMLAAMTLFWTMLGDAEQAQQWLERAEALGAGQPVPISARITLYQFEERHDLALETVRAALDRKLEDRHGTNFYFRQMNAYESLAEEEYEQGLQPYRELMPWAFAEELTPPPDLVNYIDDLIYAADMLKRAEPLSERPGQLIALVEPNVGSRAGAAIPWIEDFRKSQLAALAGREDEAIRLLNDTFDQGRMVYWRQFTLYDPVISRLKGQPGYNELIARYEAEMDRQREQAYALLGVGP